VFALWYTNFFKQLFSHPGVNQLFLDIFLICLGINVVLLTFVAIILPLRGIQNQEEVYGNRLNMIGATAGFVGFVR